MKTPMWALLALLSLTAACSHTRIDHMGGVPEIVVGTAGGMVATAESTQAYGQALNSFRTAHGVGALRRSAALERAAALHAEDVAYMGKIGHVGSNGSEITDRVKAQGYRMRKVAENVAWTSHGMEGALKVWESSPPHLANMLRPDVTDYGLARSGPYWVLVVGREK